MALSDADKEIWLSNDNQRIVLIDMEYYDSSIPAISTARLSSYPYIQPAGDIWNTYSDLMYDDIIYNIPNIVTRIDSDSTIGSISIYNTEGEYDHLLYDDTVVGHNILLSIGEPDWIRDDFITILDGVVESISSSSPSNITISIRDRKETLNVPLQTQLYVTNGSNEYWDNLMDAAEASGSFTGNLSGNNAAYSRALAVLPDAVENSHVPICLGKCFNIEPVLVDSYNHIYHIHDSDEGINAVSAVRSNGITLRAPPNVDVYSMALTTYWGGSGGNFNIGERIVDNTTSSIAGIVTGYEGTLIDGDYKLLYILDGSNFTGTSGRFTGQTSGVRADAVTPVLEPIDSVQYEVDLDLGLIRLLDHDQGTQITCDVIGQNGTSDLQDGSAKALTPYSTADVLEWIFLEKAGISPTDICYETFSPLGSKHFGNDDEIGLYYKSEQNILNIATNVALGVGAFMRFRSSDCKMQLYRLEDPVGKSVDLNIVADDIILNGFSLNSIEEPKRSITLGYKKNWKTQDEGGLAGAITDTTSPYYNTVKLEEFMSDYSTVFIDNSATITENIYPLAEEVDLIETLIWAESDAEAEVTRRAAIRDDRRRIFKIRSVATPFTYNVGDIVHITHHRFGFGNGLNTMIIGMEESPTAKKVTLEVWL